ncbi:hypothetical protein D3C78_1752070 [compost metagenome]
MNAQTWPPSWKVVPRLPPMPIRMCMRNGWPGLTFSTGVSGSPPTRALLCAMCASTMSARPKPWALGNGESGATPKRYHNGSVR